MKLIAHRGGRGFGTDNTVDAMEKAVESGVWMIEMDIRRTADNRLIVCHDATVWSHAVARATYEEIKKHSPERPLLSEVFERLAGRVAFNVEVKEAPEGMVGEMIEAYGLGPETLVTSFQQPFLERFKESYPYIRTGYLYRMSYREERKLENTVEIGTEVILPYFQSVDRELVEHAHEIGLEVFAWTVNNEDDCKKLFEWGVDGAVTDHYLDIKAFLESLEGGGR